LASKRIALKKQYQHPIVFLTIIFIGLTGCNKTETYCNNDTLPPLHCIFGYEARKSPDSVIFYLPEISDTLCNKVKMPDYLTVPLNPQADSTWLIMVLGKDTNKVTVFTKDTLLITYTSQMELINLECGYVMNFNDLEIRFTNHAIDSIYLLNNNINQEKVNHVKIFF
jgi:hypothetical protein